MSLAPALACGSNPTAEQRSHHLTPPGPKALEAAQMRCDRVAAEDGSDRSPGTPAAPLRSAQKMANALRRGQTGCLRGYLGSAEQIKVIRPGITLTSYPGQRATLRGRLWITRGADSVTIRNLDLDGRSPIGYGVGPVVNAAGTTFDHVDVTNHHTQICFLLGTRGFGRAERTVIENSRIHGCGRLDPHTNKEHGIYVADADGAVIRGNWIYDNADRGVQLYPDARGTHVYGNVIDGNGEGITIAGDGETASSGNLIEHNVISNSKVRWNVESQWPDGLVGSGNVVRENCLWASNSESYYNQGGGIVTGAALGFTAAGNLVRQPRFSDAGAGDFRLRAPRACAALLSRMG
jgi:hypothetical protein